MATQSPEEYLKQILAEKAQAEYADGIKGYVGQSGAYKATEWNRNGHVMEKQIAPNMTVVQKLEPTVLRISDPNDRTNYVELGWKDGAFSVTSSLPMEQMDDTARAFLGTIIAQMNRVLPR